NVSSGPQGTARPAADPHAATSAATPALALQEGPDTVLAPRDLGSRSGDGRVVGIVANPIGRRPFRQARSPAIERWPPNPYFPYSRCHRHVASIMIPGTRADKRCHRSIRN